MKELIETTLEEARQTLESFLEETTSAVVMEVLYVTPPTLQKN